ncbi:acetoacetate decarboxylase family protein [Salinisphaera aquimarina]|uniref:Acetoacetate decarboxylase family protein n=1 Tax=Salinisphaera aquimarina TaxID=2094031 RepID=A0ABV7EXY3_9GAMM
MTDDSDSPAPWQLTGHGYVQALRCSREFGEQCLRACPEFEGRALGGMGALMYIDYASSNVGPYRELLLSPGTFEIGGRRAAAITHIWVSSPASVANGRRNWGLPKEQAVFESAYNADGSETVRVHRDTAPPLSLTFAARGPALPVTTAILPRRWRTLEQPWHGQLYRTAIQARGRARIAALREVSNPAGSGFPDFSEQTRIVTVAASAFELVFPVPTIRTLAST